MKWLLTLVFSLGLGFAVPTTNAQETPLYPKVAETTYAAPSAVRFFDSFFTAKSRQDVAATMAHFSPDLATYTDATLRLGLDSFAAVEDTFATFMPNWGEGRSYPTRILGSLSGGDGSALVAFTDTPELFGGELRILGAVDVRGGKIVRWVDYWDSTAFDDALYARYTKGVELPSSFKEEEVGVAAPERIQNVSERLSQAFAGGDAQAAATLFTDDAVFEDMSLRTQVLGRAGIERYFGRILAQAPFGARSVLRHVVGGDSGGGFEWRAAPSSGVEAGITALALDENGRIVRATTVYDGRLLTTEARSALAAAALEP